MAGTCLPVDWSGFTVHYRYRETVYQISVEQMASGELAAQVVVDGKEHDETGVLLVNDRTEHWVEVTTRFGRGYMEKPVGRQ